MAIVSIQDIRQAAERLAGRVHRTPVMTSSRLGEALGPGTRLHFKCENFQRTGAFKIRGATNAVLSLSDDDARRGVATHSSGNHGAALAAAASARGIPCHVVVPEGAVPSKVHAIEAYGGRVIRCAPTQAAREQGLEEVLNETGATMVHPYDDERIIAGQGTTGLELIEDVSDLDVMIVPVGGGGLISGCATAAAALKPGMPVIGAEPAGADDAARSLEAGAIIDEFTPATVADGLRARIGERNFAIMRESVAEVVTVDDEATLEAMRDIWHTMKIIVEPSCAVVLAAARKISDRLAGRNIGLVLSGGNVDLDRIQFCPRCPR